MAKTHPMTMDGPEKDLLPVALRVVEGFNTLTEMRVDFVAEKKTLVLEDFVGQPVTVTVNRSSGPDRKFSGTVVTAEYLGSDGGYALYTLETRPFLWFLSRSKECRIYQDKTALDIIKEILGDYGFSGDLTDKTTDSFPTRTLCVQYRETDLDFIHRLMEEEGLYYFFDHAGSTLKMVLCDGAGAHGPIPGTATLDYKQVSANVQSDHVFAWNEAERAVSGKVSLTDYDFEKPKAKMTSEKVIAKGKHSYKDKEVYDYPGHYRETGDGDRYAKIKMEALSAPHRIWVGACNVATVSCGGTLKIDRHERTKKSEEFVVTRTIHEVIAADKYDPTAGWTLASGRRLSGGVGAVGVAAPARGTNHMIGSGLPEARLGSLDDDRLNVHFEALPKTVPYRAPQVTPWPEISGVHTAIVTGPSGEEIHTDKYGRIRIQFHWDRLGKADDTATCWVRHMTPWSGANWGMIHIPRIGQEVVVQFEEGDPDRPLVIGMLYNADTMPPYGLDANKTQSGIKTNSSKGGGGFNELMFEDKKDEELVRFQSETDYQQIVKNNADVTVGVEKADPGYMTLIVEGDLTETVNVGNHTFTVKTGDQTHTIEKGDQTLEVSKGKKTETVEQDITLTVNKGSITETIKMGDVTRTVKMGDQSTTCSLGSITEEAMQQIEMKVGANSIKIDQTGVTIKGIMVKIEGTAMLEAKAPMSTVKGDALLILKGGMTMIN